MGGTVSLPLPQYVDARYPDNKIAFRYDPLRGIIEIQRNGIRYYFDLTILAIENKSEMCYTERN